MTIRTNLSAAKGKQEERWQKCRNDFRKHYKKLKERKAFQLKQSNVRKPNEDQTTGTRYRLRQLDCWKWNSQLKQTRILVWKRYARALRTAYRDVAELKSKCIALQKEKKFCKKEFKGIVCPDLQERPVVSRLLQRTLLWIWPLRVLLHLLQEPEQRLC